MTITPQPSDKTLIQLTPVLSPKLALKPRHVTVVAIFCLLFMYLNYLPLFQTDIWGHVAYGKWILEHRALPSQDPFLTLAEGMKVVDNAWLSQVAFAVVDSWGGAEALSSLFAIVVISTWLIAARVYFRFSGRISVALAAFALCLFTGYTRHAIIRPEIFAQLLFAVMLWMVIRCEPWKSRLAGGQTDGIDGIDGIDGTKGTQATKAAGAMPRWLWVAVPLLMLIWANAHGSFAVGLAFLGCHALGAIVEAAWRTRNFRGVCGDRWVQRWTLLTELAIAASLINPYGLDLLITTATFGSNPNLRDVMEWFPTTLNTVQGMQFAVSLTVLILLARHSRQRMRAADVALLGLFAAAVAPSMRMVGWYAPVLAFVLAPHLADVVNRLWPLKKPEAAPAEDAAEASAATGTAPPRPRFTLSLVCILLIWCAFALSPTAQPLLGGQPRLRTQIYSKTTPLSISDYLRENPPAGLVFAPQWWSDWLVWDGPPGLRLFTTTNIHLMPHRVWQDYMRCVQGEGAWTPTLDRYRVTTLVVDKDLQENLVTALRRTPDWKTVFEDDKGLVAERVLATPTAADHGASPPAADTNPHAATP